MSGEKQSTSKLPPQTSDKVVDVSLRHLVIGFTAVVGSTIAVGTTIVLLRDYSKYRRQKAIIESFRELLVTVQKGGTIGRDKTQTDT